MFSHKNWQFSGLEPDLATFNKEKPIPSLYHRSWKVHAGDFNFSFVFCRKWQVWEWSLSWQRCLSYRNQYKHLLCKSVEWFLNDSDLRRERVKVNESRYIALFVFSGPIKKLFSIDCVYIYLFSIFYSIYFTR